MDGWIIDHRSRFSTNVRGKIQYHPNPFLEKDWSTAAATHLLAGEHSENEEFGVRREPGATNVPSSDDAYRYGTVRYGTVRYGMVRYGTMRDGI